MKNLLLVLLLVIISSCETTTYVPKSYYYDYDPYPTYYYNPYPYNFNYGFGWGWEYGPRYYDRHYFYKKPILPKDYDKVRPPVHQKQENRNVQEYKRPTGNVNSNRPTNTTPPKRDVNSNSGRR
jgi:hypothetical protein